MPPEAPPSGLPAGREPPPTAHGPEGWRGRAPWLVAGGLMLLLALGPHWGLAGIPDWGTNLLIPAGAWFVLRGLT